MTNYKIKQFLRTFSIKNKFLLLLIILGLLFISLVLPLEKTFYCYIKLYKQVNIILITLKTNNLQLIKSELEKINLDLKEVEGNLNKLTYWNYIPFFKNYYVDSLRLIKSTGYILSAWRLLSNHEISKNSPQIEDVVSVQKPIHGEIKNSIIYTDKHYLGNNDIQKKFKLADLELDMIDISRYPKFLFGNNIATQIKRAKKIIQESL